MNLDDLKDKLVRGQFSSLSISWNDGNGPNYQSVKDYVECSEYSKENWVSPEEKQKAIDTNSMWTAHWYPDTPIGFYYVHASTFAALLKYLEEFEE